MGKEGLLLLNDLIRARIAKVEYNEITHEELERLYIQEYGELPPNFDIIRSSDFDIGDESGFDGTAIHFYDEHVHEVYFFNRGTEVDFDKFTELLDNLMEIVLEYRNNPEKLKELIFEGNEDIYTDIYTVLLGEDQSSTEDNSDFIEKVKEKVENIDHPIEPYFSLDGHSLGGAEAQTVMILYMDIIDDINVYNDAPMNIYNLILTNDDLMFFIEKNYKIEVNDYTDLKQIPLEELKAILDKKYGHLADKITYHRNEDDLLTTLNLPYEYRLINDENVVEYEGSNGNMIDLVEKYPELTYFIKDVLRRANKDDGISFSEMLELADLIILSQFKPSFLQNDLEKDMNDLIADLEKMNEEGDIGAGHSMDLVIENIAKGEGRTIIDNQEIITVPDIGGSNKKIQLNIEETYQFYGRGYTILLGKREALNTYQEIYERSVPDSYQRHIYKVERKMGEIESNPHAFLLSFDQFTPDTEKYFYYKNFRFTEYIPAGVPPTIVNYAEDIFDTLQQEILIQEDFLEKYKEGIKKLVEADERVALLFDTFVERRGY